MSRVGDSNGLVGCWFGCCFGDGSAGWGRKLRNASSRFTNAGDDISVVTGGAEPRHGPVRRSRQRVVDRLSLRLAGRRIRSLIRPDSRPRKPGACGHPRRPDRPADQCSRRPNAGFGRGVSPPERSDLGCGESTADFAAQRHAGHRRRSENCARRKVSTTLCRRGGQNFRSQRRNVPPLLGYLQRGFRPDTSVIHATGSATRFATGSATRFSSAAHRLKISAAAHIA